MNTENRGLLFGALAVTLFSLTLPVTRLIVDVLDPVFIGLGRAVVAAMFAVVFLLFRRSPLPRKRHLPKLVLTSLGVVIGFPLFTAWAMQSVDASHGGIMLGVLPLATALVGMVVARERPSIGFWLAGLGGMLLVSAFALRQGTGEIQTGDLYLLLATISAAIGYGVGAHLAGEMGGWQVICWALVIALPLLVPVTLLYMPSAATELPYSVWFGFLYLALFSQFYGFFLWYKGLALGGIARVSQVQLLQPFLTLFFSAGLLAEAIGLPAILFAIGVMVMVFIGKHMPVYQMDAGSAGPR